MDKAAKESGLNRAMWNRVVKQSQEYDDSIVSLTILETIEMYATFIEVKYRGGKKRVFVLKDDNFYCREQFPKYKVLRRIAFEKN